MTGPDAVTGWDESGRPTAPPPPAGVTHTARGRAVGAHLVEVHDHLRSELARVQDLIEQVRKGMIDAGQARSAISEMTLRQNNWTLAAYCASYCTFVTGHHSLEDEAIFPHLRASEPALAPVIDRLTQEHVIIHAVLSDLDRALVDLVGGDPGRPPPNGADDLSGLQRVADTLSEILLSHLAYEESQLVEPLSRHGFYRGQV